MRTSSRIVAIVLALGLLSASCDTTTNPPSDTAQGTAFPAAPAPDPAYDAAASGIYKGVLAESDTTGSFWIQVDSDLASRALDDALEAELNVRLNSSSIIRAIAAAKESASGQYSFVFTGTTDGSSWSLTVIISTSGAIADAELLIDTKEVKIAVRKETSTSPIESWEGTVRGSASGTDSGVSWSSTTTGTWNFIRQGDSLKGAYGSKTVAVYDGGSRTTYDSGRFDAVVSGASVSMFSGTNMPDNMPDNCSGTFSGTSVSGTWSWNDTRKGSGTWSGSRTQ